MPFETPPRSLEQAKTESRKLTNPADFSFFLDKLEQGFNADTSPETQKAFGDVPPLHRLYEAQKLNNLIHEVYVINLEDALREAIKDPEKARQVLEKVRTQTMNPNANEEKSEGQFTAMGIQAGLTGFERKFGKIEVPSPSEIEEGLI